MIGIETHGRADRSLIEGPEQVPPRKIEYQGDAARDGPEGCWPAIPPSARVDELATTTPGSKNSKRYLVMRVDARITSLAH